MGTITLSDKQQRRAEILRRSMANEITRQQASTLLGITERQLRRAISAFHASGFESFVHRNTGRIPVNKTPAVVREKLAALAGHEGEYHDFNTCHMQELLAERNDIQIGRSTLDRLLHENGSRNRKRSRPRR